MKAGNLKSIYILLLSFLLVASAVCLLALPQNNFRGDDPTFPYETIPDTGLTTATPRDAASGTSLFNAVGTFEANENDIGLKIRTVISRYMTDFQPEVIGKVSETELNSSLQQLLILCRQYRIDPLLLGAKFVPSRDYQLAMIYSDAFFQEVAEKQWIKLDNKMGDFYRSLVTLKENARSNFRRYLYLYRSFMQLFYPDAAADRTLYPILARNDRFMPTWYGILYNHPKALDIFYRNVTSLGGIETGPIVRSLTSGIVVATGVDWEGGTTEDSYRNGGLGPRSGNGVIVYSPAFDAFILYFHMSNIRVQPGTILRGGEILGAGGNTGIDARKPGHGEHLHFEIFSVKENRYISSQELLSIFIQAQ